MSEEKKKDALADALAALAAGEHPEEPIEGSGMELHAHGHGGEAPVAPPPSAGLRRPGPPAPQGAGGPPKPAPPRPTGGAPVPRQAGAAIPAQATVRMPPAPAAPASPPAVKPRAAIPAAPVDPVAPKGNVPMRPASPNSKARPSTPQQGVPGRAGAPANPAAGRPAAPAAPARAAAPTGGPSKGGAALPPPIKKVAPPPPPVEVLTPEEQAARHEAEVAAEADAIEHVVEDDDTLNMPAPSPESLAHRRPPPRAPRELMSRTIGFKQTMIPILLTMGALMAGLGGYSFMLGEESPVATATWIPMVMIGFGALLLAFAALTMLQVRSQVLKHAGA